MSWTAERENATGGAAIYIGPTDVVSFPNDALLGDKCDTGGQRWELVRSDQMTVWRAVITGEVMTEGLAERDAAQ